MIAWKGDAFLNKNNKININNKIEIKIKNYKKNVFSDEDLIDKAFSKNQMTKIFSIN